jgi:hypothetical protein
MGMGVEQSEVLQRITRVETKVNEMDKKLDRAIAAHETAVEALSSARLAHQRLDKIEKTIFWLETTIVGAVIMAIIKFTMEGGK